MKEHGICAKCKKSVGCPYADDRITGCKNFVLEPELKLTNEESLRQCNTEQLAELIALICGSNILLVWRIIYHCADSDVDAVKMWLKQPHTTIRSRYERPMD